MGTQYRLLEMAWEALENAGIINGDASQATGRGVHRLFLFGLVRLSLLPPDFPQRHIYEWPGARSQKNTLHF